MPRAYSQKGGSEGEPSVPFCEKGGARKRADVFLHRKTEQSELCSDVVCLKGFEPPTLWFVGAYSMFYLSLLCVVLRYLKPKQTAVYRQNLTACACRFLYSAISVIL